MDISTKLLVLAADIAKDEVSLSQQLAVIADLLDHAGAFEAKLANGRPAGPTRDLLDDRARSLFTLADDVRATDTAFTAATDAFVPTI